MTRLAHRTCAILLGLGIALLAPVVPAAAQMRQVPIPGNADPRVQTVLFQDDTVVALHGHYGYQMTVEFGADERIENVSIGDSLAWQVTPNRRADTLFIKPIEFDAATNMSVITSKRRYTFQLSAEEPSGPGDPAIIYRVKFTFPAEPATDIPPQDGPLVIPANANSNYSVSGSPRNIPARIYDDGVKTYMEWPSSASTPAVFALGVDGAEAVVNFIMRGNLMVVERVAPAFVLRNGTDQTLVTNDAWSDPVPGPNAPAVRNGDKRATSPSRGFLNWGRSKKKAGS